MKSALRALLLACGLAACSDAVTPGEPTPLTARATSAEASTAAPLSQTGEITAAALADAPVSNREGITVGVLDRGRTADQALVYFENPNLYEIHRFVLTSGGWRRAERTARQKIRRERERSASPLMSQGYTGRIATLGGVYDWYVTELKEPGEYTRSQTVGGNVGYATFFDGSHSENGTTWRVRHKNWFASRSSTPAFSWSSDDNTINTSYVWCSDPQASTTCATYYPQLFRATYRLEVVTPVTVGIAGPSSIGTAGTYVWTASATGGDPAIAYSYSWQLSTDGINWTQVGTSSSYSRSVQQGQASFHLRVTATSGGSATASTLVSVASVLNPALSATISGPATIWTEGIYEWEATASGGDGQYTYHWYRDSAYGGQSQYLGDGYGKRFAVDGSMGPFALRVVVTSAGTSTEAATMVCNFIDGANC